MVYFVNEVVKLMANQEVALVTYMHISKIQVNAIIESYQFRKYE